MNPGISCLQSCSSYHHYLGSSDFILNFANSADWSLNFALLHFCSCPTSFKVEWMRPFQKEKYSAGIQTLSVTVKLPSLSANVNWSQQSMSWKCPFVLMHNLIYFLSQTLTFRMTPLNSHSSPITGLSIFIIFCQILNFCWTQRIEDNWRWINTCIPGGRHSTEVAFALRTQQPQVRFSAFPRIFPNSWCCWD